MTGYLQKMAQEEELKINPEALTLIARQASGSMRDAISLLDQLTSSSDEVTLDIAQTVLGTAATQLVLELTDAMISKQSTHGLTIIHQALDSGSDPRQFSRQIVDHLRNLLLTCMGNMDQLEISHELKAAIQKQSSQTNSLEILTYMRYFNEVASDTRRSSWQPGLLLEIAYAQCVQNRFSNEEPDQKKEPNPTPVKSSQDPVVKNEQTTNNRKEVKAVVSTIDPEKEKPSDTEQKERNNSLETIQKNWIAVKSEVKRNRSQTEALLNSLRSLSIKKNRLILGFSSDVLKSKMDSPENLQATRKAILTVTGQDVEIDCIVVNTKVNANVEDADIESGGIVSTALTLGGKLVQKDKL
jgi:DNA polymerase-3 subunit gamma/tau